MQIVLVRHPPCRIETGRCYGRLDIDLSTEGIAMLPALTATLLATAINRVVSSPARRCLRLAAAIGTPVLEPRLRELDFGEWEGRAWDEVSRGSLDVWAADPLGFAPPGGESGQALIERVCAAALSLRRAGEDCIVISHGGPLRLLPALLRDEAPDLLAPAPPFGAIVRVHADAIADSSAHSAATAHPPSTSPVKPPI